MLSEGSERWAPAQQRTVEETLRCVRGTDNLDPILQTLDAPSRSRGRLRKLAGRIDRLDLPPTCQWCVRTGGSHVSGL